MSTACSWRKAVSLFFFFSLHFSSLLSPLSSLFLCSVLTFVSNCFAEGGGFGRFHPLLEETDTVYSSWMSDSGVFCYSLFPILFPLKKYENIRKCLWEFNVHCLGAKALQEIRWIQSGDETDNYATANSTGLKLPSLFLFSHFSSLISLHSSLSLLSSLFSLFSAFLSLSILFSHLSFSPYSLVIPFLFPHWLSLLSPVVCHSTLTFCISVQWFSLLSAELVFSQLSPPLSGSLSKRIRKRGEKRKRGVRGRRELH